MHCRRLFLGAPLVCIRDPLVLVFGFCFCSNVCFGKGVRLFVFFVGVCIVCFGVLIIWVLVTAIFSFFVFFTVWMGVLDGVHLRVCGRLGTFSFVVGDSVQFTLMVAFIFSHCTVCV